MLIIVISFVLKLIKVITNFVTKGITHHFVGKSVMIPMVKMIFKNKYIYYHLSLRSNTYIHIVQLIFFLKSRNKNILNNFSKTTYYQIFWAAFTPEIFLICKFNYIFDLLYAHTTHWQIIIWNKTLKLKNSTVSKTYSLLTYMNIIVHEFGNTHIFMDFI